MVRQAQQLVLPHSLIQPYNADFKARHLPVSCNLMDPVSRISRCSRSFAQIPTAVAGRGSRWYSRSGAGYASQPILSGPFVRDDLE